jgi:hypothetical protein
VCDCWTVTCVAGLFGLNCVRSDCLECIVCGQFVKNVLCVIGLFRMYCVWSEVFGLYCVRVGLFGLYCVCGPFFGLYFVWWVC